MDQSFISGLSPNEPNAQLHLEWQLLLTTNDATHLQKDFGSLTFHELILLVIKR